MAENRVTMVGRSRGPVLAFAFALLGSAGCGGSSGGAPPRAPTQDYPQSDAQTSNGEVVGSDQVPPGDKLATSPRVGTEGIVPAATPGHAEPKQNR